LWGIEINHQMDDKLVTRSGLLTTNRPLAHVDTNSQWSFGAYIASLFKSPMPPMKPAAGVLARDLVLIGGGHAHAFVIKNLGMNHEPGVQVTLVTQAVDTPYSGMLPGFVAGVYSREECHIDLARLCSFGNVRLVIEKVSGIDHEKKEIRFLSARPNLRYDVLSIDVGSTPGMMSSIRDVTPVKPISQFSFKWDALLAKDPARIAVVGAGAGGVELLLSMQERLPKVKFTLLSSHDTVCPSHNKGVQSAFLRILKERQVDVILNFRVVLVSKGGKVLQGEDKRTVTTDEVIWCTDASTQVWLGDSGLAVDKGGFVRVTDTLESENIPGVFAVGDCANMIHHPRPKAGVFAVRQGPPLATNLRIALRQMMGVSQQRMTEYIPQSSFLGVIGTGRKYCVASRGEMVLEGEWLWRLKDWIDRKWMASYSSQLPVRDVEHHEETSELESLRDYSLMRCGGCGAKVGKSVLDNVILKLNVPSHPDILLGLSAPDDCAVVDVDGTPIAQTVDYFRSFIDDPYVFGQIATNHALSDVFAMGADAVAAMAIAVVPYSSNNLLEGNLSQLMGGVCEMLRSANCALVGGHSCEGDQISLGISVTGRMPNKAILSKGGIQSGDLLVLTKPIGTGVLFAAHMRTLAKGSWIKEALESMMLLNRADGELALKLGASACTDVTGFGLAGHLMEMMNANSETNLMASIYMDEIPLLSGAIDCVNAGVLSSIQKENSRARHAINNHAEVCHHDAYPLLFDPQTSGGLLITISPSHQKQFNPNWKVIGKFGPGTPGIHIVLN